MPAKNLAEAALRAVAPNGAPDCGDRSDHGRSAARAAGLIGLPVPAPHGECAAVQALALFPSRADVGLAAQVLLRTKTHVRLEPARRSGPPGPRSSDDRQAFAALEPPGTEDFAAAPGGHAGAKTDFAGAFLAVRAKGGLHEIKPLRGYGSASRGGGCQASADRGSVSFCREHAPHRRCCQFPDRRQHRPPRSAGQLPAGWRPGGVGFRQQLLWRSMLPAK